MEQLNRIEIRGIIGSVRVQNVGNTKVASFSVATNHGYTARDGAMCIETTFHRVTAWQGKDIQNLNQIRKGSGVHVIGRLRNQKYIDPDGTERIVFDVIASKLEVVEQPRESQRV